MGAKFSIACAALIAVSGCTTSEVFVAHSVPLEASVETIPEAQLLDVGVSIFDPGVPEGEIDKELLEELIRDGTFVSIRRTESMYMAVQLRNTLRRSGHWGGVWVTPKPSVAADINVTGEILHSDGDIVQIRVKAEDATGVVWIDKPYELETAAGAYNRQRYPELDPYQDLFNSIANDLAAAQMNLSSQDARQVRTVAELRYAGELSPDAFGDYVGTARNGDFEPVRLPATDDPTFNRTRLIRQRERVFLDTLNEHYSSFSNEASPSYDGWREYAREESIAIRELTRSARWRTGMGIATILASVVYGSNSNNNSFSDRIVRDAMMYVGMDMIRTSAVRRQEKRLHTETLEELSESFEDEVAPMVVEVQGTQHRLTGTADAQYAEWRDLLQRLFISETGFAPESIEVFAEPVPQDLDGQQADPSETSDEAPEIKEVASDASGSVASGV